MNKSVLTYIPLDKPFIKGFTEYFHGNERAPEKSAVVFSTSRANFYFQREILAWEKKPLLAPAMMSMNDFVTALVQDHFRDCTRAEELDALWLLYSIIRDRGTDFPSFNFPYFDKFISWGRHIYKFLNLVDSELVSDETLGSIQDAARKGFDIPDSINRILANIRLLRKCFHERLEKEKLTTRGYIYYHALEIVSDTFGLEWDHVWFAGLFGLTATEKHLVKKLMEAGKASLVWHGNPKDWNVLSELEKFFGVKAEPAQTSAERKKSDIRFFSVPNYHIQALKAAEIIRADGKVEDTVIVVTDISALQPLLNFTVSPLLEEKKAPDFNITIGYGIDRTSFYGLMELVMRVQMTARKEKDEILVYVPDYISLVGHPFLRNMVIEGNPDSIREAHEMLKEIFLDEKGSLYRKNFVGTSDIEGLEDVRGKPAILATVRHLHKNLLEPFVGCVSLGQIAEKSAEALKFILAGSTVGSYVLSGEIINSIFKTLRDLALSRSGKMELAPYLSDGNSRLLYGLFLEQFSGQSVSFETSPLQQLEVMGMLETRNLNFKDVVVLNCEEGILPKEREIDPLIPVGIYPLLNLPPIENSEEMYRYYFFRLISSADKVRLFYTKREDSFRSRYIEELIWERQKAEGSAKEDHVEDAHFKISAYRKPGGLVVEKTRATVEFLKGLEYSPSLLNTYLNCPLQVYFQRILGFQERKGFSADIDAAETGVIIHSILERTFRDFVGKIIGPETRKDIMHSFSEAVGKAFAGRTGYSGEFLLLEKVVSKKLEVFLNAHLTECSGHRIISLEDRKKWRREFDTGKNRILLKGAIDRIDESGDLGLRTVYDYKSGNSGTNKYSWKKIVKMRDAWDSKDISRFDNVRKHINDFQLPVYLWLVNEGKADYSHLDAALLFLRDNSSQVFFKLEKSELTKDEYHKYFMDALKVVVDHILDVSVPFERFEDTDCKNCGYAKMCRSVKL